MYEFLSNSPWICFGIFILAIHVSDLFIGAFNNWANKKYGGKNENG